LPNIKFKVGADAKDAKPSQVGYVGSRPPKGVYRVLVKRLTLTINKNGDYMLNAVLEINEPESSPKARYNKYGFWWNGNVTDEGAGYINQFLDAISNGKSAVKDAFYAGKLRTFEAPKKGHKAAVMAIGPLRIQQEGMPAIVNTRLGKPYNGETNLAVADWLLPSQLEELEASGSLDGDDDVAEDDVEVDIDESADGESADGAADDDVADDDSIEYTEEDEDNEPPF